MFQATSLEVQANESTTTNTVRLKRYGSRGAAFLATLLLAACGTWIHDDIPDGDLSGVVTIEWDKQDNFIYRPQKNKELSFQPFAWIGTDKRITPKLMYTDGGSVPRAFWNIPGLSPWSFGPAYVIHDYIFAVHRCGWDDPVVSQIKFEESAEILAEVGKFLIEAGLIKDDALNAIVWAVRTQYARNLWDTPGDPIKDCSKPKTLKGLQTVQLVHFEIPRIRRRLPMSPGGLR
jgi:hypothetical protein